LQRNHIYDNMPRRFLSYPFDDLYDDLYRVYKEVLDTGKYTNKYQIMRIAVNKPSCRFWTSAERLAEVITAWEKSGNARVGSNNLRHEMYLELYTRYKEYIKEHNGVKKIDACYDIINQPAPKFYLKPSWGLKILYKGRLSRTRTHHLRKGERLPGHNEA